MEQAHRRIPAALEEAPNDPVLTQMLSFWRLSFEKGSWRWEDAGPRIARTEGSGTALSGVPPGTLSRPAAVARQPRREPRHMPGDGSHRPGELAA